MLGRRERYSVVALICIARRENQRPLPLTEIAASQGISIAFLEQLFRVLRDQNIVKSVRGYGGGYLLARSAGSISLYDIVIAFNDQCEAKMMPSNLGASPEWNAEIVSLRNTTKQFLSLLMSTTLQHLVDSSMAFSEERLKEQR